jgi:predicted RNA binding protein YcfA (HicA-like mRNA interferase family)
MPRLPRVTASEARRAILRDGWFIVRSRGGHEQYEHRTKAGIVTIPAHAGRTINPKTIKSIIKQAGLSVDQFIDLL